MPKIIFSIFSLLFSLSSFALTIEVTPQKSLIYNKSILLEINKLNDDAFINNSETVINDVIDKIYAANPGLIQGTSDQLIKDIPSSAEARAKELAVIKYPSEDTAILKRQASSLFPLYKEGDQVEFVYDPFRRRKVKGKIKRISSEFIFTGFSDQWAIKNIVDTKIRDSFFPEKVEFFYSEDNLNWKSLGKASNKFELSPKSKVNDIQTFSIDVKNLNTRYIKIIADNMSKAPIWHHGADLPSWIFADELIIE